MSDGLQIYCRRTLGYSSEIFDCEQWCYGIRTRLSGVTGILSYRRNTLSLGNLGKDLLWIVSLVVAATKLEPHRGIKPRTSGVEFPIPSQRVGQYEVVVEAGFEPATFDFKNRRNYHYATTE
jgi:hypothetical protein